jgi:energy-coupling factor transporter ATP-binding protein EcfA2
VITGISIKDLRGIHEGSLQSLTELVVLVGPSGSGKSTVLDALLIAGNPDPVEALGTVVARRSDLLSGARWLLWKGGSARRAEIDLTDVEAKRTVLRTIKLEYESSPGLKVKMDAQLTLQSQMSSIGQSGSLGTYSFRLDNSSPTLVEEPPAHFLAQFRASPPLPIHLFDPSPPSRLVIPLHRLYSSVVQGGMKQETLRLISAVVPGLENLELLTEQDTPVLHLVFRTHSVPVAAGGDGIKSLVGLCLGLAAVGGGRTLLEEPEVHQHPAALGQSAAAIVAAVERGMQIFVSTHSLDLIDSLVAEAAERRCLEKLTVFRLRLERGQLLSSRFAGPDVAAARAEIQEDLR